MAKVKTKKHHDHEPESGSIEELANFLSLEDLSKLIRINQDRIGVFNIGHSSFDSITTNEEWESVCLNGAMIQINVNSN